MADLFIGVDQGENVWDVRDDTSTLSTNIELRFTTSAVTLTKKDVILALEMFEEYLMTKAGLPVQ